MVNNSNNNDILIRATAMQQNPLPLQTLPLLKPPRPQQLEMKKRVIVEMHPPKEAVMPLLPKLLLPKLLLPKPLLPPQSPKQNHPRIPLRQPLHPSATLGQLLVKMVTTANKYRAVFSLL